MTRHLTFELRRRKYAARAAHTRKVWPRNNHWTTEHPIGGHGFKVWRWIGDGRKQKAIHELIIDPTHGNPEDPFTDLGDFTVSGAGYKIPPHVTRNSALPYFHHERQADANFFQRAQTYRGHKTPRNNGFERSCGKAVGLALKYRRITGVMQWPAWDPLHRTPVIP